MLLVFTSSPLSTRPLSLALSSHFKNLPKSSSFFSFPFISKPPTIFLSPSAPFSIRPMSWLGKLGLGFGARAGASADPAGAAIAQGPDDDVPAPGQEFAQFGAGCFWGVELAFQRVPGVTRTEVGYSQGLVHQPTYEDVCTGTTQHSEVVRVQYDPAECKYEDLLDVFWARHDPTTLNRQVKLSEI